MYRSLRRIVVPCLAVFGALAALTIPSEARADVVVRAPVAHVSEHEHERIERERVERERIERDRIERSRFEHEREHRMVCARAYEGGASWWRLRELGCAVR